MNNLEQTGVAQLQQIELNIAKEFSGICDRHGLVYYMLGGTMLGAIRHKGFIPWDDDMDFGMPRNDYERFLKVAPKELPPYLHIVNYRNNPDFQYYTTRVDDTRVQVIEERVGTDNKNRVTDVSIDVFPIDGAPNFWLARQIYFLRVMYHKSLLSMCYKDSLDKKRKRPFYERAVIKVLDKLPIERFTTPHKEKCKIDRLLRSHKIKGSKYIGNIMGAYRTKEIVPAMYYGTGTMYPFEDTQFRGLSMYDEYLTSQYGDYMQIPSDDNKERKRHFKVIETKQDNEDSK